MDSKIKTDDFFEKLPDGGIELSEEELGAVTGGVDLKEILKFLKPFANRPGVSETIASITGIKSQVTATTLLRELTALARKYPDLKDPLTRLLKS